MNLVSMQRLLELAGDRVFDTKAEFQQFASDAGFDPDETLEAQKVLQARSLFGRLARDGWEAASPTLNLLGFGGEVGLRETGEAIPADWTEREDFHRLVVSVVRIIDAQEAIALIGSPPGEGWEKAADKAINRLAARIPRKGGDATS